MARDDDFGDELDIQELVDEGYSYDEILEELRDAGYDSDDINAAMLDVGLDYHDALLDTIRDNEIDYDFFERNAHEWADFLDMDIHELYDAWFGYEED